MQQETGRTLSLTLDMKAREAWLEIVAYRGLCQKVMIIAERTGHVLCYHVKAVPSVMAG